MGRSSHLYRNNGDGTFYQRSSKARGDGAVSELCDLVLDRHGDQDIFARTGGFYLASAILQVFPSPAL